jgi:hypothetical protein
MDEGKMKTIFAHDIKTYVLRTGGNEEHLDEQHRNLFGPSMAPPESFGETLGELSNAQDLQQVV